MDVGTSKGDDGSAHPYFTIQIRNRTHNSVKVTMDIRHSHNMVWEEHRELFSRDSDTDDPTSSGSGRTGEENSIITMIVPPTSSHTDFGALYVVDKIIGIPLLLLYT